jgi:CheY-like chemotaxis protein
MIPKVPKRILVVEDDPRVREVVCMLLAMDGHELEKASTGEEALSKCGRQIDVVLTDYIMPGMKGDELARAIKRLYPSQKIIMLTGCPPERKPEEVSQILLKPCNTEFLRRVMGGA